MLPVLFAVKGFTFYTNGIFVCLALFWCLYFIWKYVGTTSHREDEVLDVFFIALGIALLVGRAVFVGFHYMLFWERGVWATVAVHLYPGLHFLSAFLTMTIVMLLLFRRKKLPALEVMSHMGVGLLVGLAIISLGGLFSGNQLGTVTTFPLRVKYMGYDGLRHMVGLYACIFFIFSSVLMDKMIAHVRHHRYSYLIAIGLYLWVVGFGMIVFMPLKETSLVYKGVPYMRYFDYVLVSLILLTALTALVYHLRLHLSKSSKKSA